MGKREPAVLEGLAKMQGPHNAHLCFRDLHHLLHFSLDFARLLILLPE